MTIPAMTGKAPPWITLGRLAAKNRLSTASITQKNGTPSHSGHFHRRQITTPISRGGDRHGSGHRHAVAAASDAEDSKPSTSRTTPTISAQFTPPM